MDSSTTPDPTPALRQAWHHREATKHAKSRARAAWQRAKEGARDLERKSTTLTWVYENGSETTLEQLSALEDARAQTGAAHERSRALHGVYMQARKAAEKAERRLQEPDAEVGS